MNGLSFKKVPCNEQTVFPASLFNNLVLPNLNSLLLQLDELTIDPIIALIARSGCRLTKLASNSCSIEGSLRALLVETPSLTHLEVHYLWSTGIDDLTINKDSKNEPIAPHLCVIHVRNADYVDEPWCLLLNTLIQSRVDSFQSIQDIHLDFNNTAHALRIYNQLHERDLMVGWAQSLRKLTSTLPPKDDVL